MALALGREAGMIRRNHAGASKAMKQAKLHSHFQGPKEFVNYEVQAAAVLYRWDDWGIALLRDCPRTQRSQRHHPVQVARLSSLVCLFHSGSCTNHLPHTILRILNTNQILLLPAQYPPLPFILAMNFRLHAGVHKVPHDGPGFQLYAIIVSLLS